MRNQKGFFHIHIGGFLLILALIGAWYLYHSYKSNQLQANISTILNDYTSLAVSAIKDPEDRDKVRAILTEVNQNLGKYSESEIEEKIVLVSTIITNQQNGKNIVDIVNRIMELKYGNNWKNILQKQTMVGQ